MEDALHAEIKRLKVRPNTTGDAEVPAKPPRLPPRSVNNYAVEEPSAVVRPHAPLHLAGRRPVVQHQVDEDRERRLERELSESLSRVLQQQSGGLLSPRSSNVQFLNIEEEYDFKKEQPNNNKKTSNSQGKAAPPRATDSSKPFSIPESPRGRHLSINILSTWGDRHYLGLNGIEIFDSSGQLCRVASIAADPADINVLAENNGDPRVVANLIDGVNHTCDDNHSWMCPFTAGRPHLIFIELEREASLSMLRIWNYNQSRIHAERGARYVEVKLDGALIFRGEIRKATGLVNVLEFDRCCEVILFTTNHAVLAAIESNDRVAQAYIMAQLEVEADKRLAREQRQYQLRQGRVFDDDDEVGHFDCEFDEEGVERVLEHDEEESPEGSPAASSGPSVQFRVPLEGDLPVNLERPLTGSRRSGSQGSTRSGSSSEAAVRLAKEEGDEQDSRRVYARDMARSLSVSLLRPSTAASARNQVPVRGRVLDLCLLRNWGDGGSIGLTGFVAMDLNLEEVALQSPQLFLGRLSSDISLVLLEALTAPAACNLNVLVDGINTAGTAEHAWRVPLPRAGQCLVLRCDLGRERDIKGLKVWNFVVGGDRESACCGVKHAHIFLDGRLKSLNQLVRKAPDSGLLQFDFSQFLPIQDSAAKAKAGSDRTQNADQHQQQQQQLTPRRPEGPRGNNDFGEQQPPRPRLGAAPSRHVRSLGALPTAESVGITPPSSLRAPVLAPAPSPASLPAPAPAPAPVAAPAPSGAEKEESQDLWQEAETGIYEDLDEDEHEHEHEHEFGQPSSGGVCIAAQQWATPVNPTGVSIKFVLQGTHGDASYVGLNGIALFDARGQAIPVAPDQVQALPFRDINDLLQARKKDVRCLENLVNGSPNDTFKDRYMWLCPLSRVADQPNTVFFLLDRPISLGSVRIWNYSKTPSRGVKELEMYIDDVLVYRGSLACSPCLADMPPPTEPAKASSQQQQVVRAGGRGGGALRGDHEDDHYGPTRLSMDWGSLEHPNLAQSIVFSNDARILSREESRIPVVEDELVFFDGNERVNAQLWNHARPMTAVSSSEN